MDVLTAMLFDKGVCGRNGAAKSFVTVKAHGGDDILLLGDLQWLGIRLSDCIQHAIRAAYLHRPFLL